MAQSPGPLGPPMPIGKPPVFMSENKFASSEGGRAAWFSEGGRSTAALEEPEGPVLDVERCRDKELDSLMGKAFRNPLTGKVSLKDFGSFPDYVVADLYTRKKLSCGLHSLHKDPYLLRVIPLQTRTWIYHQLFKEGKALSMSGVAEDAMIRSVLEMPCIDADVSSGKWSSVMFYAPILFVMCLSKDLTAVIGGIFTLCATLSVTIYMNNPKYYRLTRVATWPLRAAFFVWIIWRMGAIENGNAMTAFGFVFALIFTVVEMCSGDCSTLQAYRLHCHYEVLRPLPNRLFICCRHGAAHSAEIFGSHLAIDEKITGIATDAWQSDYALIADVKGLIVELKPVLQDEWNQAYQDKEADGRQLRYIGLDVFAPGQATIRALAAAISEQNEIASQKRKSREASSAGNAGNADVQAINLQPMNRANKADEVQLLDA